MSSTAIGAHTFYDFPENPEDKLLATGPSQRTNVFANKLTSVLSASYADAEIRDALRTFDQTKFQNTAALRRRLRLDVHKEVIDCNAEIINDFGAVAQQLRQIGSTLSSLNDCCETLRQHLAAARRDNAPIIDDASTLLAQRQDSDTKRQLLSLFQSHFVVSEDDLRLLTTNTDNINDDFFRVLARVKQIHNDCRVLLGAENQRLGLEIMDASSRNLNTAYQKLYRWIQREFKTVNFENPQISSIIRRALRALSERPTLFQSCLDFFTEARQHALLDAFYIALTGASNGNHRNQATKPIEFHAHDSLRYIGDMLAWTHSAAVSEKEVLENLASTDGDEIAKGIKAGTEREPWSMMDDEAFDGGKAFEQLASRNLGEVIRTLRQRVEQVIHNQEDPLLAYKIVNLFGFYSITFGKLLGHDCDVLETISALESLAMKHFQSLMEDQASSIKTDAQHLPRDLRIPDYLEELLTQLKDLLKSFHSSLTPAATRENDFKRVLSLTLDPLLRICKENATSVEEPARSIFLINCSNAAKKTLSDYDFVQSSISELGEDIANCTISLTEYQHAFFLHNSGLHPLIAALAALSDEPSRKLSKIAALPEFQPVALQNASQVLDEFLPSALVDATENLKNLADKKLVDEITADGAERFCEDFEFVEENLIAIDEGPVGFDEMLDDIRRSRGDQTRLRAVFPRTSGEIRVLLS
ncbi:MAG: hypothetical protein Q9191_000702 [Dirinaria sp. TL-2023a]